MPSLVPFDKIEMRLAGYNPSANSEGYAYDPGKASHAADFFPTLRHVKNSKFVRAGAPFDLAPWQDEATRLIFGSVNVEDQTRRYRTVYIEVPRKNGKTTWCAGLAAYGLFADREDGAECYCAAADKDQASLLYDIVHGMVRANRGLNRHAKLRPSVKRIIYQNSYLRAISSDAHTKHGFNSHFTICDEFHSWKGRELWDVLKTSTGARPQPLTFIITTAGWDRTSICWELHEYARQVRDGRIQDPTFLPILYGADEKDDWTQEEVWKAANPNYGVSLSPDYMRSACNEAIANPSYQNTFRRLHLNQWTQQSTRWLDMDAWRQCHDLSAV